MKNTYYIESSDTTEILGDFITDAISEGYRPWGSPFTTPWQENGRNGFMYYQAMIKDHEEAPS